MGSPSVNILLVEDNPDQARRIGELLGEGRDYAFNLQRARRVSEMAGILAKHEVDGILLDLSLPDSKGLETFRHICWIAGNSAIIVLSEREDRELAMQAFQQGAQDYLVKDQITPEVLQHSLANAIERNRARLELSSLAAIVDAADDAIIGKTLDGIITSWNKGAEQMYGYSAAEAIGSRISMLAPPEAHAALEEMLQILKRGERIEPFETVRVRKDGTLLDVSLSIFPLLGNGGKVVGAAAIARDVTKRKRSEAALRDSEARLRLIEDATDEIFWMGNPDVSQIYHISPAFERIFGRSRQSLEANPLSFIDQVHPEDRERVAADLQNQRLGKPYEHQFRMIHPNGSTRWISNRGVPVRDAEGNLTRYVGISKDVTERVQLEDQLRQSQKMEAVGRLAGGVAHDFNNLLTVISGFGELIQEKLDPASELRGYCEEITKASANAAALTRQLLAFSRRQLLQPVILDLNEVLKNIEKMLRRLIGENIDLRIIVHPELWRVKADVAQMEQVLLNLAVNARDAMPKGGSIVLELQNADLDEAYAESHATVAPGKYVVLVVTDSGEGMDGETRARIFEPFFTTKEQGKGTGLGLATVYGIVKQSGGFIWVYSEPQKGTSFKIYLPYAEGEPAKRRPFGVRRQILRGTESILLVEDDQAVRGFAAEVLQTSGYKVISASDPQEALRVVENQKPAIHLLLTDVVMPKWSGRDLANMLAPKLPAMKVLFMSGYTENAIVHQCVLNEGTALLAKPFTPAQLLRMIRGVLEGHWPPSKQPQAT
jgi:PAS domain S-box-containing protein